MGVKIIDNATTMLENTMYRSTRSALSVLRAGGKEIRDLAREMAPRDQGNLEDAIKTGDSSEKGIHGRKIIEIYIDEGMNIPGRPGYRVGQYSTYMHEGNYKLGKESRAKQAGNPGIRVGRKYLERASNELGPALEKAVERAVSKSL